MSMPQQADVVFTRAPPTTTFTNIEDPSSLTYETRTPTSHTRRGDDVYITQPGEPPIVAGWFETIVDAKMEELQAHGMAFLVKSLLADGVQGVQSTPFVSMVARTMLNRLAPEKMERFKRTLRAGAMEGFRLHWQSDGDWRNICSTTGQHSILTLTGINKASLLGSLFSAGIVTADDIGLCLSILLGHIHFDRLCAIHALLVCADDRLCEQRHLSALLHLQKMLRVVDPLTGLYMWGPVPHSQALIQNILLTIEGWMTVQAREQCRSTWQPPSRAVGPRMRARRMRNRA
ncbi:hypothetical protein EDD22DRAFT_136635 [Suillus occidentalis]|nr:hypothetical protein EDD22DRAFT_136635 [Suillus occidentalis]